jgi:hypothetical protein
VSAVKVDPFVAAGADHLRRRGVPNHKISVFRVGGDHAHMVNAMFDDPRLDGIVVKGNRGYAAKVLTVTGERCPYCKPQPVTVPELSEVRDDLADHPYTVTIEQADHETLREIYNVPDGFSGLVLVERERGRVCWVSGAAGLDGLGGSYEKLVEAARKTALEVDAEYVAADL